MYSVQILKTSDGTYWLRVGSDSETLLLREYARYIEAVLDAQMLGLHVDLIDIDRGVACA